MYKPENLDYHLGFPNCELLQKFIYLFFSGSWMNDSLSDFQPYNSMILWEDIKVPVVKVTSQIQCLPSMMLPWRVWLHAHGEATCMQISFLETWKHVSMTRGGLREEHCGWRQTWWTMGSRLIFLLPLFLPLEFWTFCVFLSIKIKYSWPLNNMGVQGTNPHLVENVL